MVFFADFEQHFVICQKVQIFVKKSQELHIIKCITISFKELFSEFNYLYYFLSYVVIEYYKREKSYCTQMRLKLQLLKDTETLQFKIQPCKCMVFTPVKNQLIRILSKYFCSTKRIKKRRTFKWLILPINLRKTN